jgi:quercetin dioxygenase-like cupin family protein
MGADRRALALSRHERLEVTHVSQDLLEVEATYDPGGKAPPAHLHPEQDEHFEVLEGVLRAETPAGERLLAAGDTLDIPRGTPHRMANGGEAVARVRWQVRPALDTLSFFEALSRARTPAGQALAVARHRREFRLARL